MKLKISLKTGSRDEAVNLGKKILKDVKSGEWPIWGFREIAAPNMTSKPVICHDVSSGQYLDEGKDVCFGMHLDGADLIIIPGLLTNWCATPSPDQQRLHIGRLTSLLLYYRPYFHSMTIS